MWRLRLLVLAVLAAGSAEAQANSSDGFLEFSVGKFTYFVLSRRFPQEAVLRHISSNVTFLLFQIHSQYQNTTVSYTKIPFLEAVIWNLI